MIQKFDSLLGYLSKRFGDMTESEEKLAEAIAVVLCEKVDDCDDGYEVRCVGAMVATIEMIRGVKNGEVPKVIKA